MTTSARLRFDALISEFCENQSLSEIDKSVLDHTLDGWPMTRLVTQYNTTLFALHRRKRELTSQLRDFLLLRGIGSSTAILDDEH